jgi:hypothetical protein
LSISIDPVSASTYLSFQSHPSRLNNRFDWRCTIVGHDAIPRKREAASDFRGMRGRLAEVYGCVDVEDIPDAAVVFDVSQRLAG